MRTISSITVAALLAAGLGGAPLGRAQAPAGPHDDTHHPDETPPPPAPAPARPTPGMGMGMGMGMAGPGGMRGGMPGGEMDRMMQMMRMAQERGGAADMHLRRIEGLLGYVRAELRITEAQAAQWTAFADAVRAQSQGLRAAMRTAMVEDPRPAPAPQQMARRIAFLSAMLEAMRGVAAAAGPLYAVLSEEQRRTADELMAEHVRAMRIGMP
ncbi:Spy/CpxP family protein refolding chaperone [Falsiroseomonas oryziterrae]|uniref:Spy/CpxP family protein refolding chaperone n=1 Tax=Falsiroseomonas oryziterrae TaxID=2911368 RepID=UPI001F1AB672|nr:Spy/CpxP family protein refolding chaperone [Roseomonas sp. NPKOSM-4]